MSDRIVYAAPERHMCEIWTARGGIGSVWRCGTCGRYWKFHSVGLVSAGGWHPMTRFEMWQFKRRQARVSPD